MKNCSKCNLSKPLSDFYKAQTSCKECCKIATKKWKSANQNKVKNYYLNKGYSISIEEYQSMFDAQGGICKICLRPESMVDNRSGKVKNLAVDHCHESGKVRGLLCYNCNVAIGFLRDNSEVVQRAADYLKKTWIERSENQDST